jgi:hypothetical protein
MESLFLPSRAQKCSREMSETIILYLQLKFGTSLPNIYLFQKIGFGSFKLNFPKFQQLRNKNAKYILCCAFVIVFKKI